MLLELSAFAPRRCLDGSGLITDRGVTRDTTVLFVDLAGFTVLTESLSHYGSRGTEQLSNIVSAFFGEVTREVLTRGGDPVAYGGDALTITFDGSPEDGLQRAAGAAQEIHRLTELATSRTSLAGTVSLTARIGIASGSVSTAVASTNQRAIPVHVGTGLDDAVTAEEEATGGQTIFSATTDRSPEFRPDQTFRLSRPGRPPLPNAHGFEKLVHPVVRERIDADAQLPTSHRTVSVAFVGFQPVAANQLAHFIPRVNRLLELADNNGGEVVQVSGGDKGVVALVVFGAPVAHDNDPLRAVHTMLELRRDQPSIRVGITTGPVFAAFLGSAKRWFPAHFGASVNVAARLMQHAEERQILVCPTTWRSTASYLRQRGVSELVSLKGVGEPLEVHAVVGWRSKRRPTMASPVTPFVGRTRELETVERYFDLISQGEGGAFAIRGEAGIGKSRLTEEAIEFARTRGIAVLHLDANDIPRTRQHRIWRSLLSQRLEIAETASGQDWAKALHQSLPHAADLLPLVGRLIGVRLPERTSAPDIATDVEVELAQSMICQSLVGKPAKHGLLFVLDNTHLFDSRSRGILKQLSAEVTRSNAGLISVGRQPQSSDPQLTLVPEGELILDELDIGSAAALASDYWRQLGGGSPPEWLPDGVIARAGGNPLFIQIATRMTWGSWAPGSPVPRDPGMDSAPGMLLAERIDMLHPPEQRVLNVLATNTNPCSLGMLAAVLAEKQDERAIAVAVDSLEEHHLVRSVMASGHQRFRIRHESLQRVVYERMSHADRKELHHSLASQLIAERGSPVEIAHHVQYLDDPKLGKKWFPLAAAAARDSWLVPEAIDLWRSALPLLSGDEYEEAQASLLELLLIGGQPQEALDFFDAQNNGREPGADVDDATSTEVRARLAVAVASLAVGDFDRSDSAARLVMRLATSRTKQQEDRAREVLVIALCERGDTAAAVDIARKQVKTANRSGNDLNIIIANASLGAALFWSGQFNEAIAHYELARAKAQYVGDSVHEIHILSDLAGCVFELGDHTQCLQLLGEARRLAEDIGYRRHLVFSLTNEGQVRISLGDPFGTACHWVAFQRAMELGDIATATHCVECWVEADTRLAQDPAPWQRLIAVNQAIGREHVAMQLGAHLAMAVAQSNSGAFTLTVAERISDSGELDDDPDIRRRLKHAQTVAQWKAHSDDDALPVAISSLDGLIGEPDATEVERAGYWMEKWRISTSEETSLAALAALREAFAVEPSALVRSWFTELNEPTPTPPPPLPPPVGIGEAEATPERALEALSRLEETVGLGQPAG